MNFNGAIRTGCTLLLLGAAVFVSSKIVSRLTGRAI